MSDHTSPLRHALRQAAVTGTAGSLLLGAAVVGIAAPGATAATTASARTTATRTAAPASPVTLHAQQVASKKRKVDVHKELRTAAAQKGKPYRYGAAGPHAFDCSGYTSYVLKQQGIKLARTSSAQYRQTRRISHMAARPGDLVFYYNSRGVVYHVGILAGHMIMWVAPHTGTVVRLHMALRA